MRPIAAMAAALAVAGVILTVDAYLGRLATIEGRAAELQAQVNTQSQAILEALEAVQAMRGEPVQCEIRLPQMPEGER